MKNRGWIVWTWGKMGGLLVFAGMMLMLLAAYRFIGESLQAEGANQLAQELRNLITDTYTTTDGMTLEYELPERIDGRDYSLEIKDLTGDMVGVMVETDVRSITVGGGASIALRLSNSSSRVIKGRGEGVKYICMVKHNGRVYIEKSRCS
jgi:hypothetical protein